MNEEEMSTGEDDRGNELDDGTRPLHFPVPVALKVPEDDQVLDEGEYLYPLPAFFDAGSGDVKSPSFFVGGYPWRLMIYPAGNSSDCVSVFLELDHEHEQCPNKGRPLEIFVRCKLEIIGQHDPRWTVGKEFKHRYNDPTGKRQVGFNWGFKALLPLEDVRDPNKGYIGQDGSAKFRAEVIVVDGGDPIEWGEHSTYDSHRKTGMVGLQNQGMTCYMNSVLQTLFHTPALRSGVYDGG